MARLSDGFEFENEEELVAHLKDDMHDAQQVLNAIDDLIQKSYEAFPASEGHPYPHSASFYAMVRDALAQLSYDSLVEIAAMAAVNLWKHHHHARTLEDHGTPGS